MDVSSDLAQRCAALADGLTLPALLHRNAGTYPDHPALSIFGTEEKFTSLSQCVARLQSLTKPFLNWAGKAERQQITVPTEHRTQCRALVLPDHVVVGGVGVPGENLVVRGL